MRKKGRHCSYCWSSDAILFDYNTNCYFLYQSSEYTYCGGCIFRYPPTVVGLISIAAIKVAKTSIIDSLGIILVILSVLLVVIADVPAFYIIIGGAAVGLTIYRMFPKRANKILSNRGNKK